jgi:hypothetical protein
MLPYLFKNPMFEYIKLGPFTGTQDQMSCWNDKKKLFKKFVIDNGEIG